MTFYWVWIPLVFLLYAAVAFTSKWAQDDPGWKWVAVLYVLNAVGLWPLVAKYSKNLMFDGLLYETIMFLGFYGVLIIIGTKLTVLQYVGVALVLIGLLMVKSH